MHGHSGVEVRGRPADILRVSPVGETLIAGLSGACLHPLSLLGSPLIFFSFFLFLIQGLTLWLRRVHGSPPASVSPVLDVQTALAYVFSCVWIPNESVSWELWLNFSGSCQTAFQSGMPFTLHPM